MYIEHDKTKLRDDLKRKQPVTAELGFACVGYESVGRLTRLDCKHFLVFTRFKA